MDTDDVEAPAVVPGEEDEEEAALGRGWSASKEEEPFRELDCSGKINR